MSRKVDRSCRLRRCRCSACASSAVNQRTVCPSATDTPTTPTIEQQRRQAVKARSKHMNWTELNYGTELELRNKQPHVNSRIRIGVLRISQEQSVLVSLQPIKSWCRRAWPMNVSCIWVALLSVSSVKFISCSVNTSIGMLGSELQFANSSSVQFMCCEQAVILMTWDVGNIETSGYSYGSDSSLRCDVTPLLHGSGCVRRTQKLDSSIAQCVSGTCHPKAPLPVGVSGSPPYLTPNLLLSKWHLDRLIRFCTVINSTYAATRQIK